VFFRGLKFHQIHNINDSDLQIRKDSSKPIDGGHRPRHLRQPYLTCASFTFVPQQVQISV
jgi:hypothetical protein